MSETQRITGWKENVLHVMGGIVNSLVVWVLFRPRFGTQVSVLAIIGGWITIVWWMRT